MAFKNGCLLLALFLWAVAEAQNLVIFGDSLSDVGPKTTGGGYQKWLQQSLRTNLIYPNTPYAIGRWSNGPLWPDHLQSLYGIQYTGWAAGGATSGAGLSQVDTIPGDLIGTEDDVKVYAPNLLQQLQQHYLSVNSQASPQDVHIIFIGNNDYFSILNDGKNVTAEEVVGYIFSAFEDLYGHGARNFIVATIPPLAALPASFLEDQDFVDNWSAHNDLISASTADFNSTHPDASLKIWDFGSLVLSVAVNANSFGFTHVLDHCLGNVTSAMEAYLEGVQSCSQPDSYLFWDNVHPTTAAHKLVAQNFAQQFGSYFNKQGALPTLSGSGGSPAPGPGAVSNRKLMFLEYAN